MSKAIILVGSGTDNSRSLNLGATIKAPLIEHGAEVELIDLLALNLPSYNMTTEKTGNYNQETAEFLEKSKQADGFVWVTPVYHNSFSSLLKTALDWQHWLFDGKVLGLASHSERSTAAVDQLLMVARSQHFVTIPTRVCTADEDFDANKKLVNPEILDRINGRFVEEFMSFLHKFSA